MCSQVQSRRMIAGPTRDTNRNQILDHSTGPSMVTAAREKHKRMHPQGPGEGLVPFWRDRGVVACSAVTRMIYHTAALSGLRPQGCGDWREWTVRLGKKKKKKKKRNEK